MQAVRFLLSPSGRLRPQAFVLAIGAVYAAGLASQWLTAPGVTARAGPWPFAAAQVFLLWVWYALHAKRLRDAGRPTGLALGVAVLYALSVALLVIVAASFFNPSGDQISDANTASATGLVLLVLIVAILLGSPHYDLTWLVVVALIVMALLPVILAVAVTLWAAVLPRQAVGEERTP